MAEKEKSIDPNRLPFPRKLDLWILIILTIGALFIVFMNQVGVLAQTPSRFGPVPDVQRLTNEYDRETAQADAEIEASGTPDHKPYEVTVSREVALDHTKECKFYLTEKTGTKHPFIAPRAKDGRPRRRFTVSLYGRDLPIKLNVE